MAYIISSNTGLLGQGAEFKSLSNVACAHTDDSSQIIDNLFIEGYLRNHLGQIEDSDLEALEKKWPLPDNYSGSFAFTLVTDQEIIIANDCIGVYPVYYHFDGEHFTVSNALPEFKKIKNFDIDDIGKFQRQFAPENSEIGSRTLLKGVKRLLPGEKISFNYNTKTFKKNYDNRLYANMHERIDKNEIEQYWQILKDEIKYIESLNNASTDIALSGGLDSRILIGAMKPEKDTIAYHYGKSDHYETKIAKKTAKVCGISFKNRMDYANQFPEKSTLKQTIKKVGPPYSMNWYNLFEMAKPYKTNLIIGDMCEALHGRNIKAFSTRESRINNYFKHYVLNKDYTFTPATENNFEDWKQDKIKSYLSYIEHESLLKQTSYKIKPYQEQILKDINEIFERIAHHQLPYAELYDELFLWFTHSRIPMGRQITHCNERFYAYAPAMSSAVLIASSNIHPNLRLNYRFNNKLFKEIKALKPLNKIPVSQVPYLSRKAPDFLQFLVWGARSQADQLFINRMLKLKKPHYRYRLLKSLNWVKVYQNKDMKKRLDSYFKNACLSDDVINATKKLASDRNKLEEWPLSNTDIMSICVLNLEIEELYN